MSADPFQYKIYFLLSALNLLLQATGLVGWLIRIGIRGLACEVRNNSAVPGVLKKELDKKSVETPVGKVIGAIEGQLYLYSLVSGRNELLVGIVTFKAFTGWLFTRSSESNSGQSSTMLVRYYTYALGNFVSVAFSIFIFETVKYSVFACSFLQDNLWIPKC